MEKDQEFGKVSELEFGLQGLQIVGLTWITLVTKITKNTEKSVRF